MSHMGEVNSMYRAIRDMVDDGTRTSMYNPLAIQDIGDPEADPKLVDWQDSVDASSIFRVLCRKAIGNKAMTDIDGARRFLCLPEVQHILQRTAWFPFNVSRKIGRTAELTEIPDAYLVAEESSIIARAALKVTMREEGYYKAEIARMSDAIKKAPPEKQDEMKKALAIATAAFGKELKEKMMAAASVAKDAAWHDKWTEESNLGDLRICILDDDFADFPSCFYAPDEGYRIRVRDSYAQQLLGGGGGGKSLSSPPPSSSSSSSSSSSRESLPSGRGPR